MYLQSCGCDLVASRIHGLQAQVGCTARYASRHCHSCKNERASHVHRARESDLKRNSPRPQRGQGRSDLFSKENLRFSPPPTPSPTKFCRAAPPPPPPHPCRLDPKSCPAGLEIFGVRRRPAPWVHFCRKCADNCKKSLKNCFFVLKSMTSWWPGLPDVSETRLRPSPTSNPPAGQACQPSPPSLRPKLQTQPSAQLGPGASLGLRFV